MQGWRPGVLKKNASGKSKLSRNTKNQTPEQYTGFFLDNLELPIPTTFSFQKMSDWSLFHLFFQLFFLFLIFKGLCTSVKFPFLQILKRLNWLFTYMSYLQSDLEKQPAQPHPHNQREYWRKLHSLC